jgi:hypothetical protein
VINVCRLAIFRLGEIKSVETMIKNEKHYEYAQECAPRVEYLILKLKIIR